MGWLVLGLVLGLLVGAGVVAAVLRSVGRITGTDRDAVLRLVLDGLRPGRRTDGVAAQRGLARRLKRTGQRTASGRRVAAEEVTVQISPEDEEAIAAALGIEAAEADLTEFYREHASTNGWLVGGEPVVRIVKDISLRPRQAVVRAEVRALQRPAEPPPRDRAAAAPDPAAPEPVERRRPVATRERDEPRPDDATTDVLPRELLAEAGAFPTAVYPIGATPGDLVVVHGTDVRTVPAATGSIRIGRGAHNDLVVARPGVGRDHLVIEVRGGAWWIVPGTAQGGTTLDGHLLDGPTELTGAATVGLGRGVRLRLSVEGA
jgi:hypothetical protein